jgi:hypothetical protein
MPEQLVTISVQFTEAQERALLHEAAAAGLSIVDLIKARMGAIDHVCQVCGCTDECGCPDSCYWHRDNLCSKCAFFLMHDRDQFRREVKP